MSIKFAAKRYLDEQWGIVPLVRGRKHPSDDDWQNTTYGLDAFSDDTNIGGKCGAPSGDRVDVDLDVPEAIIAADIVLPNTGLVHGRRSKPRSHRWFISKGALTRTFKDLDATMLLELRASGQTVLPPSIWTSKSDPSHTEQLAWDQDGTPLTISPEDLTQAVTHVAIATLLGRHWPQGSRHLAAGALAGFLARLDVDPLVIGMIVEAAATIGGDDEVKDRVRFAAQTAAKHQKGGTTTGGKKLTEYFADADKLVTRIYGWLGKEDTKVVDELNAKHFVVRVGKDQMIGLEEGDEVVFQKAADLRLRYQNQFVPTKKKNRKGELVETVVTKADFWLTHRNRREYGKVVFAPPPRDTHHPRDFNLWRGFAVQPDPKPHPEMRCAKYLDLVHNVICSGNVEWSDFLLDLLALGVQQPGIPSEVIVVLRSRPGTGKGSFVTWYGSLFGSAFRHYSKPDQLTGKFNADLGKAVVVFADEAISADERDDSGPLNRLITEKTLTIEPKGIDRVEVPNNLHIFMATNNEYAYRTEIGERRAFMLDVSEVHLQDHEYFEAIRAEMENGGAEALLAYLQARPIDRKLLRKIPDTPAKQEQQERTFERLRHLQELRWWKECLILGRINDDEWPTDHVASEVLHNAYIRWCETLGIGKRASQPELIKRLQPYVGDLKTTETKARVSGKRRTVRGWLLPDLTVCRRLFDEKARTKTNWPALDATQAELPFAPDRLEWISPRAALLELQSGDLIRWLGGGRAVVLRGPGAEQDLAQEGLDLAPVDGQQGEIHVPEPCWRLTKK